MADVAERRRQKLLARANTLSQTGANPRTTTAQAPKPDSAQPASQLLPPNQTQQAAQTQPTQVQAPKPAEPVAPKAPSAPAVDYKLINKLQTQKTVFALSKRVYRFGIAVICGVVFHYFYVVSGGSLVWTLQSFMPLMLCMYYLLNAYEYNTFQKPIDVMLKLSEERIENSGFKISDFIQGDTGNKLADAFVMFDRLSNSDMYKKFKKASTAFQYISWMFVDTVTFVVACCVTDALFRTMFENLPTTSI